MTFHDSSVCNAAQMFSKESVTMCLYSMNVWYAAYVALLSFVKPLDMQSVHSVPIFSSPGRGVRTL